MRPTESTDILVIGAGAAGMTAAFTAALRGRKVLLLEGGARTGRKLLATGNGRCNFTNLEIDAKRFNEESRELVTAVLSQFSEKDALSFFDGLGIPAVAREGGYIYPRSRQAAAVRNALQAALERSGVSIHTEKKVLDLQLHKKGFLVICADDSCFFARCVILAAGGQALPGTGSDGSGYRLASSLGHRIRPVVPALVPLICREKRFRALSGVRVEGEVVLSVDGRPAVRDRGELQLTEYGISGIPVFQVSRAAARALEAGQAVTAHLDFWPEETPELLSHRLKHRAERFNGEPASFLLCGMLPDKLAGSLLKESGIAEKLPCGELSGHQLLRLTEIIKSLFCTVTSTRGFEYAQVCSGGVVTEEIDPQTLQSRLIPGLYFAGEIIDVDGPCGGYNLQWAWSCGHVAGAAAAAADFAWS